MKDFLKRTPVGFPIGLAGLEGADLARDFGNDRGGLPFTAVFDARGRQVERHLGETHYEQLLALDTLNRASSSAKRGPIVAVKAAHALLRRGAAGATMAAMQSARAARPEPEPARHPRAGVYGATRWRRSTPICSASPQEAGHVWQPSRATTKAR